MMAVHDPQIVKGVRLKGWRHLYPFPSRYLKTEAGLDYHYLDEGRGEPLLMLHGNPTWSFYYRNMVSAFSGAFRVIVPDHMGCGLSDAPGLDQYDYRLESRVRDLERLMDHLAVEEKLTLVVHDWGGMIGVLYALRNPERIGRLVLTNTAGFFPPKGKGLPVRLRIIRNCLPFAAPAVLGLNLFSEAALYMAPRKPLPKAVKKGLTAPYCNPSRRMATLMFVRDIPLRPADPSYSPVKFADDHLAELARFPMLFCWGIHDFVFDSDYLKEWRRRFPDADFHVFDDAGHYLLEDKPVEVTALVKDFLKKNPL